MPELNIRREHRLGLRAARAAAARWAHEAEREWGMQCRTESGVAQDVIHFERTGASGSLTVDAHRFDLQLKLGFLLGAYAGRIGQQIRQSLDEMLGQA
ncbi:MAG: polyhydroxyalkanoic acid system family protein [Limnohabitans sp.]